MTRATRFHEADALHSAAVAELATAAGNIPEHAWNVPVAEGKWTPSQVVGHLTLAYGALIHELTTGSGMRVRTKWWQRLLLRLRVRPGIIAGRPFPKGIRSPREIAPPADPTVQTDHIAAFEEHAQRFASLLAGRTETGAPRLTHPYLGGMNAEETLRFCAAHVRHHLQQLPT